MNIAQKADIALADLASNGGLLLPEQNDTFFRRVLDEPTLVGRVRAIQMTGPTMNINKIGIGSRVLHGATQTGSQNDDGTNSRVLAAAKLRLTLAKLLQRYAFRMKS
jgi:hypothetical protein